MHPRPLRSLASSAGRLALFGAAVAAAQEPALALRGALAAPVLFFAGAALAGPPVYLSAVATGARLQPSDVLESARDGLDRVSTLALGLALPAAYFAATLDARSWRLGATAVLAVLGVFGALALVSSSLRGRATPGRAALALVAFAASLGIGARLLHLVGRTFLSHGGAA